MKKGIFWDGTDVEKERLLEMLREYDFTGDTSREFDIACRYLAEGGYEGHDEDIEFILEKLQDRYDANLQDVDDILRGGNYLDGWYFSKLPAFQEELTGED